MEKVKWKCPQYFNGADAQKVYEELGDTDISAKEIVEKAKDPNSELHKCFEWDDKKAAEKWRLQQARVLICNLVFEIPDEEDTPVRAFYITTEKEDYKPTKLILQQPDEYKILLNNAKAELQTFKRKYKILQELAEIFEKIDEL